MSNLSLYELTSELVPLEQALEATGGDVTGQDALVERVTDLLGQVQAKVDAYGMFYKSLEALAKAMKEEESRLAERRRAVENKMKRLKDAAQKSMEMRSLVKLEGLTFTVSIQKNGGKPPVAVKVPVEKLPGNLVRQVLEPDLEAIRGLLEAGHPEIGQYAELGDTGHSVRIR